jgi:uncharacterized protein
MMKFLVLIAVVFLVIWYMRGGRHAKEHAPGAGRSAAPRVPQEMVECPVCHVHLPRADALPGPGGQLYCCAEHQQRAKG